MKIDPKALLDLAYDDMIYGRTGKQYLGSMAGSQNLKFVDPNVAIVELRAQVAELRGAAQDVRDYVLAAAHDPANTVAIRRLARLDEALNPLLEARELWARDQQNS